MRNGILWMKLLYLQTLRIGRELYEMQDIITQTQLMAVVVAVLEVQKEKNMQK
jgi:hypothetical protein